MAGFHLLKDPNTTVCKKLRVSSQAYTLGDAVMLDTTSDSIDVVPATAATTTLNIYAVAMETVTSAATSLLCAIITPEQEWKVDSTNNSNASHSYQRMILTDKATVNNTGTTDATSAAIFLQTGVSGATTDKKLVGKFIKIGSVTA